MKRLAAIVCLLLYLPSFAPQSASSDEAKVAAASVELDAAARKRLKDVVRLAYTKVHDGWSTDEVLLQDKLNADFLEECRTRMPDAPAFDCNWMLLTIRKAGDLSDVKSTRRKNSHHDDYQHAAEVAARFLEDKHRSTTDRIICDPKLRAEFDRIAQEIAPKVEAYALRKAAFALRKARQLQPELVLRVAAWKKTVEALPAEKIVAESKQVSNGPGVYVIRDATGYLYIGESAQLRTRITKHLDRSDRQSLASYLAEKGIGEITVELHTFDSESEAKEKSMRRAYESELIRSRKPRFNLAP